jgi:glycerol kinase
MQFLADMLDMAVERPEVTETTALGAAILAGIEVGLYPGPEEFAARWRCDKRFEPAMAAEERNRRYAGWRDAVRRTRSGG